MKDCLGSKGISLSKNLQKIYKQGQKVAKNCKISHFLSQKENRPIGRFLRRKMYQNFSCLKFLRAPCQGNALPLRQLGLNFVCVAKLCYILSFSRRRVPLSGNVLMLQALRQPGLNLRSLYHIDFKKAKSAHLFSL